MKLNRSLIVCPLSSDCQQIIGGYARPPRSFYHLILSNSVQSINAKYSGQGTPRNQASRAGFGTCLSLMNILLTIGLVSGARLGESCWPVSLRSLDDRWLLIFLKIPCFSMVRASAAPYWDERVFYFHGIQPTIKPQWDGMCSRRLFKRKV